MDNYYYSAKNNGFYPFSLKDTYELSSHGWPDDAIPISDEYYQRLIDGQKQGKVLTSDINGNPVLSEQSEPSFEEVAEKTEFLLAQLMSEATTKIAPLQDAVDLGIATEKEKINLVEWKRYRVALNRIDISIAADITLPKKPL
ncbi:tail fiber assembly protein [Serratia ureilytica]|uniref:Tail fiber assembly protein n=1 Tax=Serratia ureilytica TaxID=300181 RepID=A0A9X9G0P6_9GAMM|nr:tail fiber assembly protein [Serratia ureilytica]TXE22859.1 tail fiber assembly protein [Serratia ureilytica]